MAKSSTRRRTACLGRRGLASLCVALASVDASLAGPAVNQFETKNLEVDVGDLQFQSQNAFSVRNPRRKSIETDTGGRIYDDNTVVRERFAQELEAHLTSFFRMRVGLEFEKQRFDDPGTLDRADAYDALKLTELALEGVLVVVPVKKGGGVGMGLIAEYQHALSSHEADTLFMGTILQAEKGPWSATANLFMVRFFSPQEDRETGRVRDNKWDFAYASQVKYKQSDAWSFALEAYGTLDRLGNSGTPGDERSAFGDHDQHRVGPIVYYSWNLGGEKLKSRLGAGAGKVAKVGADDDDGPKAKGAKGGKRGGDDGDGDQPRATLGVGVLAGVTPNTPALTLKWSLEVEF